MIIQRLYELAQRDNLAGGIAFEKLAVPFVVSFDENGSYLGILDRRSEQTIPSKGKNAKSKIVREIIWKLIFSNIFGIGHGPFDSN